MPPLNPSKPRIMDGVEAPVMTCLAHAKLVIPGVDPSVETKLLEGGSTLGELVLGMYLVVHRLQDSTNLVALCGVCGGQRMVIVVQLASQKTGWRVHVSTQFFTNKLVR